MFVFDEKRMLRYQGRVDSNPREAYAKVPDARNAIDAVLVGRHGAGREDADGRLLDQVARQGDAAQRRARRRSARSRCRSRRVDAAGIKALRQNTDGQDAARQLLGDVVRAVHGRVPRAAEDLPDVPQAPVRARDGQHQLSRRGEAGVRRFLEEQHASTRNLLSATMDPYELMKAFDPEWNGGVPYSMVIAPGGEGALQGERPLDMLKTRRLILASFPDDDYVGQNAYWNSK